ncbi:MAG: zinc-dependent alcohol dehydrogenase family protein [Alphaproteobacteria bacterium]|jgi:alcohol dehydrogenase|nr:zinc-dependent alcohol dehydrogenase family protein [Alphaproteobacteria bacterium]
MRVTAAVLRQIGAPQPYAESKPISIEEVELDPPGEGEVLVKVGGGGLCHSDLSVINGARPQPLPLALGHEGAGEVVEIGAGIRDIAAGDRVVFQFGASCGRCRRCLEGRPQICETNAIARAKGELMGGGKRFRDADGKPLNHHAGLSCFSQYTVVDRGSVVKVDADISLDEAALFGCAVMTGVGSVLNTARIRAGDKVAVIGLGGVGLNGMLGAILGGAGQVIAVDISPSKLGLARQLGAHETVDATEADHVEQIRDLSGGGVDFAFEFAGSVKALETGYKALRPGGTVVIAGLAPADASFEFLPAEIVSGEKGIQGSYMGSCVPVRDIPRYIEHYKQGRLPVDRLINQTVGYDELNVGFDRLTDGETVRQILLPNG